MAWTGTLYPLRTPHDGFWESGVRSIKLYLRCVVEGAALIFEELSTVLAQIKAILNSLPLAQLSDHTLNPLTPAHFLVGQPYTAFVSRPADELIGAMESASSYGTEILETMAQRILDFSTVTRQVARRNDQSGSRYSCCAQSAKLNPSKLKCTCRQNFQYNLEFLPAFKTSARN